MADTNKKVIDFTKLKQELTEAIEADKRYWRENEVKIQAIHQKVGSYDEFKDLVKAAHLKPLDKEDKMKLKQKLWNSLVYQDKTLKLPTVKEITKIQARLPATAHELVRVWRHYNTPSERFFLLKEMYTQKQLTPLKAELGFGLLGEISEALLLFKEEVAMVVDILEIISQTNRFNLNLQFLSVSEKKIYSKLFQKLNELLEINSPLTADNNITERIPPLMDCYKAVILREEENTSDDC